MDKIVDLLVEKIGARNAAVILALVQMASATYFASYKNQADAALTATRSQALESVKRAIDQAAAIAAQDAEVSMPACQPAKKI